MHYIYKITNSINNKVYIGQSKDIKQRWRVHKMAYKNNKPTQTIHHALIKYGIENFIFEVIASCLDQNAANAAEEICIKQENSHISSGKGYNFSLGGSVAPKSKEWIEKVKATRIANDSYKQSEETKKRMSENWHIHHPIEGIQKTAESNRGRPCSEQRRQKIAKANKGKQFCLGHKQPESVIRKRMETIMQNYGDKTCAVNDCDRIDGHKINGIRYCSMHGQRLRNQGTLELLPRPVPPNKGKPMSAESKAKLSKALKGRIAHNKIIFTEEQIISILSDTRPSTLIAKDLGVGKKIIQRLKKKKRNEVKI